MRIRRCAARLLGSDYSSPAPPPVELELPPAPPFELPPPPPPPPPLQQPCSSSSAYSVAGGSRLSASSAEPPCGHNRSPWDLMAQLDPSDPQELELFKEKYFVSLTYRSSWLFPASKPTARMKIKEEEFMEEEFMDEEGMAVDNADDVNYKPWRKVAKKKAKKKKTVIGNKEGEKNASSQKIKKERLEADEDDDYVADGGEELWMCKKNDGKTWFCRRPVSQPDSYCLYHSDPKRVPQLPSSEASKSSKRRRKRALEVAEGFYYYTGFGPSRSKRQCIPSSSVMESPPSEQEEEAPAEKREEAPPKEHADLTAAQPQVDDADDAGHQVASAHVDEPMCDDTVGIAGCDEESSDDAFAWNGEPRVVDVNGGIKRKSPFKKKWRKPVKARSLKSLMI